MRAEAWRQAQLLRAVVCAWEGHTCYKLHRQGLKRKARRHRSLPELCLLSPFLPTPPPPSWRKLPSNSRPALPAALCPTSGPSPLMPAAAHFEPYPTPPKAPHTSANRCPGLLTPPSHNQACCCLLFPGALPIQPHPLTLLHLAAATRLRGFQHDTC